MALSDKVIQAIIEGKTTPDEEYYNFIQSCKTSCSFKKSTKNKS